MPAKATRRAARWTAVVVIAAVAGTGAWLALARRDAEPGTPVERLRAALHDAGRREDGQRVLGEWLASAAAARREPFVELLALLDPEDARRLAALLSTWPAWDAVGAARLAHALETPEMDARLSRDPAAVREGWRSAVVALYGSELLGRLRGGEPIEGLVDLAARREGAPSPITRMVTAFHLGAAAIRAGVPTETVVAAGEALLGRPDPTDRSVGAELVRLNAPLLAGPERRRQALQRLLEAAQREESQRTFFFLADGLAALNVAPGGAAAPLGVGDLRPLYERAGYRWRSTCLAALHGAERDDELRRLALALAGERSDDDAVGAARTVLMLGDEPLQLEVLQIWGARGGAREPEAFGELALRRMWRPRRTRAALQQRILASVEAAARRRDPAPALFDLLMQNAVLFRDDAGFAEPLTEAGLAWATSLEGEGFWRVLLAWGQLIPPGELPRRLESVAARSASEAAGARLRSVAQAPARERRDRVAALLAQAQGSEAAWWRFVADCCGG